MIELIKGSRSKVLAGVLVAAFALIALRLFDLQVIKHSYYTDLAVREQVKTNSIPAQRGLIYAMDGEDLAPLVMNQDVYILFADPTVVNKPDEVERVVREVAGAEIVSTDLAADVRDESTQYKVLARNVTLRQAEMIKDEGLSGIGFQKVSKRVYPESGLASQVLGFVNHDGRGQYGLEEYMNDQLAGKDGLLKSVTDVADVPLSIGSDNIRVDPVHGQNIAITIDRNVQSKTEEALLRGIERSGATHGSVVVMDPNTGKVVSMANYPTYNPGEYTSVMDASAFVNGAITVPFEPGSVMKTFTLGIGLDKGVIRPDSTFYNTDSVKVGDYVIGNAAKGHTGNITMQTALNWSLNTGMVDVAKRLGGGDYINRQSRDTIYEYLHDRFGIGSVTGIELAGETKGTLISPEHEQGNAVRFSNVVFGQGLDATMIQVAAGFGALINGGTYYSPTVVSGVVEGGKFTKATPKPSRSGVISESASKDARHMAYVSRSSYTKEDTPGFYVGGKTGTSQTIKNGKYVSDETIGTYLGFGGTEEETKYVIMVQMSGARMNIQGNLHAMPIFTEISNWLLEYYQLEPRS